VRTGQPIAPYRLFRAAVGLVLAGCTAHGRGPHSQGGFAEIDVGSTVVRQLDGQHRRGGTFDASTFEVDPGPHRLVLVFALPARSIGLKALPAQAGIGVCELEFEARAGHRYYLGARPLGDSHSPSWPGTWEAWVRDPAVASEDDIIARCQGAEPAATPTPTATVEAAPTPTPLLLPGGRALRVGAWRLPELAAASAGDRAAAADAIRAAYDVLAISPPLEPTPLLAALGSAWAASAIAEATVFYRRDLVRPCPASAPAAPCLESVDAAFGDGRAILLVLPPAEARP
jgi:hypothetical protein